MENSTRVMGIEDTRMWASMEAGRLELQCCEHCQAFRYPPAPVCPECLSDSAQWLPVSGSGTVLSWVVFHRQYFRDHVPPYNCVAVRLDEGPIIVSQLMGPEPSASWMGERVRLGYAEHAGRVQHHVVLVSEPVQQPVVGIGSEQP